MIGSFMASNGGRKLSFGTLVLILVSGALGFGFLDGQQYTTIITILVPTVCGTIAAEDIGAAIVNRKNGG